MSHKKASLEEQLHEGLAFMEDLKAGNTSINTLRTTKLNANVLNFTAEHIKYLRENNLHVSQAVLAYAIGVSTRTVQAWEVGKNKPSGAAAKLLYLLEKRPSVRKDLIPA
jgi:putative transcriptional regulator